MTQTPDHTLDARGLLCPEPVMLLHNKIRDMAAGELLELLATDPSTRRDVPQFCSFLGHELVQEAQPEAPGTAEAGQEYRYLIRKQAT